MYVPLFLPQSLPSIHPSFLLSFFSFLHPSFFLSFFLSFISVFVFYLFLPVNICERERHTIICPPGKIIHILQASYGRQNSYTCPNSGQGLGNIYCHSEYSHAIVVGTCDLKPSCELFADNSVFGNPCVRTDKYLMVRYQCLDGLVNICERERRTISCPPGKIIHILQASYGRQNRDTCPHQDQYTSKTNCHAENSHAIVEATCKDKPSCELFADNSVFGDPCFGTYKYLMVKYQCVHLFVLCQSIRGTLSCQEGETIRLLQASYGRQDIITCPHPFMFDINCHFGNAHKIVEEKCHKKPSCELFAVNSVFGEYDPCPETHKYLRVMYDCI